MIKAKRPWIAIFFEIAISPMEKWIRKSVIETSRAKKRNEEGIRKQVLFDSLLSSFHK